MEILIFIFPLLSFLIFQFSDNIKNVKFLYILHTALMSSSFVISIYLFQKLLDFENDLPLYYYPILKLEKLLIDWSLRLDLFVSGLLIIITLVATIFIIYSINFYKDNKVDLKIIKYSSLSIFGSLTLVSSNNLIQLFLGWQIILVSCYFLTNLFQKKEDLKGNDNVFLYNRVSDLGIFLCLFFLYSYTNSIDFDVIFESSYLGQNNKLMLLDLEFTVFELILCVLFLSFLFRCRQFFIGSSSYHFLKINSSLSALIYSGIFLPSGIYLILRFLPLTETYSNFLNVIALLGFIFIIIFTILIFKSKDLKSLTVYVASSQFSIIVFLIGLKVYNGAFFYLLTSTLSVTMLFLSYGIIITKLNGEHQIDKMGLLLIKTPFTFLLTLTASLSLICVPFFSSFYSKKLILSSLQTLNETFMFFSIIICLFYFFLFSYTLFKNILIVFWCQNNCNIHLYNKINENMFLTKIILLLLATCLIFSGWFLNNLFSGPTPEYFWNLVLNFNSDFALSHENQTHDWFIEQTNLICLFGISLSIFNYVLIPKFGNSIRIKHNKFFKYYSSYLSSSN